MKGMPQRRRHRGDDFGDAVGLAVLMQGRLQLDATFADGSERHRIEGFECAVVRLVTDYG